MARLRALVPLILCSILLILFATVAWLGVRGKSATFDETLHAPAAFAVRHLQDFRVNPEDPALFHHWASLAVGEGALPPKSNSVAWHRMLENIRWHWEWCVDVMYRSPGVDADAYLARLRAMMLAVGVGLGALIGWWAWRLGGAVAGVVAVLLWALDPNFLAHSPLMKNDVSLSLVMLALAFATWRLGQRATWGRMLAVGALCGAGVLVKFSGLLMGPILIVLLAARVLVASPWMFLGRELSSRGRRALAALGVCFASFVISYGMIWATYGLRFAPTPGGQLLDTRRLLKMTASNEVTAQHPDRSATPEEIEAWKPGVMIRALLFAEEYRLLPQAWTYGLHYTHMSVQVRYTYLLGDYSLTGWWYYFPLALLFKTPLATLVAIALASVSGVEVLRARNSASFEIRWAALCVALPMIVYGLFSITTNLNLGLRHMLPIYPFVFVAIGCAAARVWARQRVASAVALAVLAAGLAIETAMAFPNFLPFFNGAVGRTRGGIELLGDSNLDWGQDLRLLGEWRRAHPDRQLYLCYFGSAYPAYYGIDYTPMPGGYFFDEEGQFPSMGDRAVVAISATHLQGIYHSERTRADYQPFWERRNQAITVLGGTIYLFDWPPTTP